MMTVETATQIKSHAREIGFDKIGIARVGPAPGGERLREWLDRGYHAGMNWMAKNADKRLDPERVLPGARSVICLAVNYYSATERRPDQLKISRYAWGIDYHHVLGEKLKKLTGYIEQIWPDSRNLWYVDTGPVMEKAWAQQAGLGWNGKNDILISRDFGTWLFLAEIITTLELAPDTPELDHCGNCTKCLEACPTGAIVEPYVVDSRRCISYWTIEHQGDFPPEMAGEMNGWVFGCDICQDVCPFNRFQKTTGRLDDFGPRPEILSSAMWQELGEKQFAEMTRNSPLRRPGFVGMRRNLKAAGVLRDR